MGTKMPPFFLKAFPFLCFQHFFSLQYLPVWLDTVLGQALPEQGTGQASGRLLQLLISVLSFSSPPAGWRCSPF